MFPLLLFRPSVATPFFFSVWLRRAIAVKLTSPTYPFNGYEITNTEENSPRLHGFDCPAHYEARLGGRSFCAVLLSVHHAGVAERVQRVLGVLAGRRHRRNHDSPRMRKRETSLSEPSQQINFLNDILSSRITSLERHSELASAVLVAQVFIGCALSNAVLQSHQRGVNLACLFPPLLSVIPEWQHPNHFINTKHGN